MSDRVKPMQDQRIGQRDLRDTKDWTRLGARIRQVAWTAAALHLVQLAGGELDGSAAVETPRSITGG